MEVKKINDSKYTGTAGDVVGIAEGEVSGFAFNWKYSLNLPVDGELYELSFDDWMYLVDENNLINKAEVTKFGVVVGRVTLLIQRK